MKAKPSGGIGKGGNGSVLRAASFSKLTAIDLLKATAFKYKILAGQAIYLKNFFYSKGKMVIETGSWSKTVAEKSGFISAVFLSLGYESETQLFFNAADYALVWS